MKNHVELFRAENVALETEEAKLCQQYQKLIGAQTVNFRGEEKTLVQMGRYLEEPDRALRQEAWELVAKRRLQDAEKCEEIFDELIQLRTQIAKNAGFENYRDFMFRKMGRFDYTPEDCVKFHDAVEKEIMPAVREIQNERKRQLKLEKLRPWDLAVDPQNRAPLKPFAEVGEMVSRTQNIFNHLDAGTRGGFPADAGFEAARPRQPQGQGAGRLSIHAVRGARAVHFHERHRPAARRGDDLHEAGHAFHAQATRDEDLYAYRGAPIEFCEVASMSMELLGNEFLEEFYPVARGEPRAQDASRRHHRIFSVDGDGGRVSALDLHASRPHARRAQGGVSAIDGPLRRRRGLVRATRKSRAHSWHRQLHIFIHPFYYVEYGIAQLGALQVWANSKANKAKALNDYKTSLALGGSRPLPELFAAAGCKFQFDAATIKPLIQLADSELKKL